MSGVIVNFIEQLWSTLIAVEFEFNFGADVDQDADPEFFFTLFKIV